MNEIMDPSIKEEYDKRYNSMMNSDLGMTTKDFQTFDVVNFENDSHYQVEVIKKGRTQARCDCPDFQLRGRIIGCPCKHVLFVLNNYDEYKVLGEKVYNDIMRRFEENLSNKEGE